MPLSDQQIEGRSQCLVTASRVPDLFNEGHGSYYQLWHECAGLLPPSDAESVAMKWGNRQEKTIAEGVAEDEGWKIRPVRRHLALSWVEVLALCKPFDNTHAALAVLQTVAPLPLGASLDFEIAGSTLRPALRGWIPLEIKAVGRYAARKWEGGVPPDAVTLQSQTQVACAEAEAGGIAGLRSVTGPADVAIIPRHEPAIKVICLAVVELGLSLARGEAPAPDLDRSGDIEAVLALHKVVTPGKVVDRRGDPAVERILADYKSASAEKGKLEKETKGLWAELLVKLGPDADFAEVFTNEHYAKTWPLPEMDSHRKAGRGHNVWERK